MYRLEIWDRSNTRRRAIATTLLAAERTQRIRGEATLVLQLSAHDGALTSLTRGAVLRLQQEGDATDFSLWRLARKTTSRGPDGRLVVALEADALWGDLAHGRVRQRQADGSALLAWGLVDLAPTAWLSNVILPAYDGDALVFQAGTIEPSQGVDLTFERTSPLEALRMLEGATQAELQFRYGADGRTCYVDLLERIGTEAGGAELRYSKNVRAIERLEDESAVATRLYASGAGGLTLADARWRAASATAAAGGSRTLSFAEGASPVFEDGALVGCVLAAGDGTTAQVTASSAAARTLTIADASAYDWTASELRLLAPGGAEALPYLESPAGVADCGVRVGDLVADDVPDATNLVANGDLKSWAAGLPVGFTKLGAPQLSESAQLLYAKHGGRAARVVAAAADEGLLSAAATIAKNDRRPYHGLRVGVTVVSGRVRAELRHSNGSTYPLAEQQGSEGLGVYLELTAGPLHDEPLPEGTAQVAVVAHGGPAEVYLDTVMVTPQTGSEVPAFVATSGAALLWQRAAEELARLSRPRREYRVELADLYRVDPSRFPFDELRLGDAVKVRDPDIGTEDLRVVEISEDLLSAAATRVAIAEGPETRPLQDADLFAPEYRQQRPAPTDTSTVRPRAAVLWHDARAEGGSVYVTAVGNATTATLELYTKTSRTGAYPGAPVAMINGRQGTFAAQAVATGGVLFYRIVARDGRGVAEGEVEGSYSRADGAPPTLEPRRTFNATRTAADLAVRLESPTGERVRLLVKDSEAAGASVWRLCTGNGNAAARWVASGTEVESTSWFTDGAGAYAQKLLALPLSRDQIRRIYLQAEAETTALKSTWLPYALEAREQPWLESIDAVWDEGTDELRTTVVGGAHVQSVRIEASSDDWVTVAQTWQLALTDAGGATPKQTASLAVGAAGRGKRWTVRATPYNGALVAGVVSGYAGAAQQDSEMVPASETGGVQPPTARIESLGSGETAPGETLRLYGALGAGGRAPLSWRLGTATTAEGAITWGGWQSSALPADVSVAKHVRRPTWAHLELADADGRTARDRYQVEPRLPGLGGGGRVRDDEPMEGGPLPFGRGRDSLDDVQDSATRRRPHADYVDASGRVANVYRGAVVESVGNLFKRASDTLDQVADSATFRRLRAAYTDASQRLISVFRGGADEPVANLFKRGVDTLDDVQEGGTYKRTTAAQRDGGGRASVALNSSNRLATGVEATADINGDRADLIRQRAAAAQAPLVEDFSGGFPGRRWKLVTGSSAGATTVTDASAVQGGTVLRHVGYGWYEWSENIPFDPDTLYEMRVRVRKIANPATGQSLLYAGFNGVAADGVTRVNIDGANNHGSQHYFVVAGANLPVVGDGGAWSEFRGYLRGSGARGTGTACPDPASPAVMHDATRFVRPMLLLNYSSGGTTEVDVVVLPVHAATASARVGEEARRRTDTLYKGDGKLLPVTWERGGTDEPPSNFFKRLSDTASDIVETTGRWFTDSGMLDASRRIVNVFRGAAAKPVINLFAHDSDTLDQVRDGTSTRRIGAGYSDTSGRITSVYRGAVVEPVANLFKRASDTLDQVADSATFRRLRAAYTDASQRLINVYRGSVDEPVANLFKRGVDTLSDVGDGGGYARTTVAQRDAASRADAALDGDNDLRTGLTPTARIGPRTAREIAVGAQSGGILITFDELPAGLSSTVGATIEQGGVTGRNFLRLAGGYRYWYPNGAYNVPFDPSKLYRLRVRVRTYQKNLDGTEELFYAGWRTIDADGTVRGNYYGIIAGRTVSADAGGVGVWCEYTTWVRGYGAYAGQRSPDNPSGVGNTTAVAIEPMFLANYASPVEHIHDIDYFAIDVFDEDGAERTYKAIASGGANINEIPWMRGGVSEPPTNLFKRGADTAADVVESAGRSYVDPAYLDQRRPNGLLRSGALVPAINILQANVDHIGLLLDGGGYARTTEAERNGAARAATTIAAPGQLAPDVTIEAKQLARGIKGGVAVNEANVDFAGEDFDGVPAVVFGLGGLTFHPDLAAFPHGPIAEARNLDRFGFDAVCVLRTEPPSTTPQEEVFVGEVATIGAGKQGAYNDRYTFRYAVSLATAFYNDRTGATTPSKLDLTCYTDDGTGPVPRATRSYRNYDPDNPADYPAEALEVVVDGMMVGDTFRIAITSGSGLTRQKVTWTEALQPQEKPMGTRGVPFLAMEGM